MTAGRRRRGPRSLRRRVADLQPPPQLCLKRATLVEMFYCRHRIIVAEIEDLSRTAVCDLSPATFYIVDDEHAWPDSSRGAAVLLLAGRRSPQCSRPTLALGIQSTRRSGNRSNPLHGEGHLAVQAVGNGRCCPGDAASCQNESVDGTVLWDEDLAWEPSAERDSPQ